MSTLDVNALDWSKMGGLIPAIVQHAENGKVLLLGYMNEEALMVTLTTGQLNLYSRSRKRLWRKGESSGNSMTIQSISTDCDQDSLLVLVLPKGPACHLGFSTCFQPDNPSTLGFIGNLVETIEEHAQHKEKNSYTAQLLEEGINHCAQKVGEEAIETVIAATTNNREGLTNESADLLFHFLVLLQACELNVYDVLQRLQLRHT